MLISAAKRLTTGHALGIDIWQQEDQASNCSQATLENARCEGVSDRIELRDSDARELPFLDESFDVVISSFAIHNIYDTVGREKAIREIHRVLKPGGQLALADIRHTSQYAEILRSLGWNQVIRWFPNFLFITPTRVIRAAKPDTRS
jgi:ubiquinone/menaquinone biosynthesis C-methylase UbiE